jgi:hypothetical protein
MEAATWTAIAILAAGQLGTLFYLGSRIDSLAARIDERFDAVNQRLDAMNSRFDAHLGQADHRDLR